MEHEEMVRAPFFDENGVKKGAWSPEEDDKLESYIKKYGHWNWRELPKFAGLSRCGKSCRLRWMNYLRPGVKHGNFSKQEEEMIIELHEKFGNKWSKIAAKLPGRTDNEVKNYWHTHLKKRTRDRECCESSSGSEDKQNSSTDPPSHEEMISQNAADHMVVESGSSAGNYIPPHLILESSPLSPLLSSSPNSEFSQFVSCDNSSNWNITAEDSTGNSATLSEPFEYCSGDFWTQPFVPDQDHNHYILSLPPGEGFMPNSYFSNYEDGVDLFYRVMNELP